MNAKEWIIIAKGRFSNPRNGASPSVGEKKAAKVSKTEKANKTDKKLKTALIAVTSVIAVLVICIVCLLLWQGGVAEAEENGVMANNVVAMGVDISGKTKAEAMEALEPVAEEFVAKNLTIRVFDPEAEDRTNPQTTFILTPEDIKAAIDLEAMVNAAYTCGRNGVQQEMYELHVKDYLNLEVEERVVGVDELGDFAEAGLCGTAAVISPIGKIVDHGKEYTYAGMGTVVEKLYKTLTGIQMGTIPAPEGWIMVIE